MRINAKSIEEVIEFAKIGHALVLAFEEYDQSYIAIGRNYDTDDESGGTMDINDLLKWYELNH